MINTYAWIRLQLTNEVSAISDLVEAHFSLVTGCQIESRTTEAGASMDNEKATNNEVTTTTSGQRNFPLGEGSVFDPNSTQNQLGQTTSRPVLGYPDYVISSNGVVRDLNGNEIRTWIANNYTYIRLFNHNGFRIHAVHRLVATHFLSNPDNLRCVCHKDDNPRNNDVSNLFWGSHADNMQDMIRKGRKVNSHGQSNGKAILSEQQIDIIRSYPAYRGYNRDLALMFNVSRSAITHIRTNTTWKRTNKE